jgi:murein DD-endopeptidase MepM/ murein hydrolase activator NlpD
MKHIVALCIWIILWISSVSLVFGWIVMNLQNITPDFYLSKNIFPDSNKLNYTVLWFKHEWDISDYTFESPCKIETKFLGKENFSSFFKITFLDNTCKNPFIALKKNGKIVEKSSVKLEIMSKSTLYNTLVDLSSEQLQKIIWDIKKKISSQPSQEKEITSKNVLTSQKSRKEKELQYKKEIIEHILKWRSLKYSIPVAGYSLPIWNSKIPNAWRPYRVWFTDGIHHAWDIDAPVWTPVIALDDAIVVRVVDNWDWGTLSNLRKGKNLTREDMERNLDILRGNQIWIKTMKGEVVMYNHLETVTSDLEVWDLVNRESTLWTIWISWVPEADYSDSHLDFSIMVNSYNPDKAGKYEAEEYMFWDWKMKWQSKEYILEHQYDFFEK